MNGDGTKLCVANTMTGKAYIVQRETFAVTTIDVGPKPHLVPQQAPTVRTLRIRERD
jgi:hypothetical protein